VYKPLLEKAKKYKGTSPYSGWNPNLSYGHYSRDGFNWHGCRETFHTYYKRNVKLIYISASRSQQQSVAKFMAKFEQEMNLAERYRLKFLQYDNNKSVLGVLVSSYWRSNTARRELLTILLRAAIRRTYRIVKDFNKVRNDSYLKRTKKAVDRFIATKGRLKPRRRIRGWLDTFSGWRYDGWGRRTSNNTEEKNLNRYFPRVPLHK